MKLMTKQKKHFNGISFLFVEFDVLTPFQKSINSFEIERTMMGDNDCSIGTIHVGSSIGVVQQDEMLARDSCVQV